ncbi:alpha-ketoacid dehydrogenase subunit beta [Rhizobium rhizogenes]|uniref:alpha-ketoacid dehydrogenase subunit beta n=1 Tax=Rhizobium rhizogenes TaxID=359 RepID=UPI001AEDF920|nr:transketolase C-terminal domain-containing protein [Rhizobium rhizogenes]
MSEQQRVSEALNRALHTIAATKADVIFLGEDILDPYGGAFKVSRGLSTQFPGSVFTTPISEQALIGVAAGLALSGNKPIVEIMFGDFIALAFDQILNFATKSVSMYGSALPLNLLVRCPVGAGRGYGPTHSQSLQKHFVGIPNLALYELSPFHDISKLLHHLLELGHPSILFEDKVLYTQRVYRDGVIDDIFSYKFIESANDFAQVYIDNPSPGPSVIISPGGLVSRSLNAARILLIEDGLDNHIIVPSRLYPFDIEPLLELLADAPSILIVEEGTSGGTWGSDVAQRIYERLWGVLKRPLQLISSRDSIIPSAPHLEKNIVIQHGDIIQRFRQAHTNALPPHNDVSRRY